MISHETPSVVDPSHIAEDSRLTNWILFSHHDDDDDHSKPEMLDMSEDCGIDTKTGSQHNHASKEYCIVHVLNPMISQLVNSTSLLLMSQTERTLSYVHDGGWYYHNLCHKATALSDFD